ncbi:MAG: glycosyltransferase family 9 protein, partial [Flavobacteriales bacterium]
EDHWSEVVDGLVAENRKVHLIGGPAERDAAARLMGAAGDQVVNACGSSWTETFALLSQANLLVAGDTGAMHAGAAMQVPMVVVWGCTSPALGMGPWRAHPATVELEPEGPERSRPCSRLGDRCRHRTPCIRRVSPQRILVAARHILSQTAP